MMSHIPVDTHENNVLCFVVCFIRQLEENWFGIWRYVPTETRKLALNEIKRICIGHYTHSEIAQAREFLFNFYQWNWFKKEVHNGKGLTTWKESLMDDILSLISRSIECEIPIFVADKKRIPTPKPVQEWLVEQSKEGVGCGADEYMKAVTGNSMIYAGIGKIDRSTASCTREETWSIREKTDPVYHDQSTKQTNMRISTSVSVQTGECGEVGRGKLKLVCDKSSDTQNLSGRQDSDTQTDPSSSDTATLDIVHQLNDQLHQVRKLYHEHFGQGGEEPNDFSKTAETIYLLKMKYTELNDGRSEARRPWTNYMRELKSAPKSSLRLNKIIRKLRGLLNKLTKKTLKRIVAELSKLDVWTKEWVILADMVFEKVILEPGYVEVYVTLIKEMTKLEMRKKKGSDSSSDSSSSVGTFHERILSRGQQEFNNQNLEKETDYTKWRQQYNTTKSVEERRKIIEVWNVALHQSYTRFKANIRFLAELFVENLVNKQTIHQCLSELVQNTTHETDLECFCILLTVVREPLENRTDEDKLKVAEYFTHLDEKVKGISSGKIRCLVLNLTETRHSDIRLVSDWYPTHEIRPESDT